MKRLFAVLLAIGMVLGMVMISHAEDAVKIVLSDEGITVDGQPISESKKEAVYAANDIVFYLAGQDFTYGEGTEADGHTQEEADAHTVVHITEPGVYELSGKLSAGQIAVDIDDAKKDEDAVVTLILSGVDITCTVAPAVIFYNVYECSSDDEDDAIKDVDTSAAGANVIIADGTVNNVTGSYVARIYDPETVKLSEDGTEVEDADKLHKYDAAFYSKRTMNISGGEKGDGVLNINAANEGLDSELHLTINGGNINITSGNDGINTNEDNVSVTTVNGGSVNIVVNGATGEGDGIDSNGWLVINGGSVTSAGCGFSGDAGIDSDMGIYVNGGTICASGNMFDHIAGGDAPYAVFSFAERQKGGSAYALKNEAGETVAEWSPVNDFTILAVSGDWLAPGTYTLWQGETQLGYTGTSVMAFGGKGGGMGGRGGRRDFDPADLPEGFDPANMPQPPEMPEGFDPENMPEPPEGFDPGQHRGGKGGRGGRGGFDRGGETGEASAQFVLDETGGSFSGVAAYTAE